MSRRPRRPSSMMSSHAQPPAGEDLLPAVAVVAAAGLHDRGAELLGIAHGGLEELDRSALEREEVERLEHDRRDALGPEERHVRGDHRAVGVAPQRRGPEAERVHHRERLLGHHPVEPAGERGDAAGAAVADAVGSEDAVARRERGDRLVEGVRLVAPAAVEDDDRGARSPPRARGSPRGGRGRWGTRGS